MDTATLPEATPAGAPDARAPLGPTAADPAGPRGGRLRHLVRGPEADPAWARPALLALLVVTAVAYLWNLTASGWANAFYSAAVQAGSTSWKAFFFGSLDASNAITVDKPPASLWAMALSVRLFGLSSFAILLPQVLMGIGTVAVVHATVRRHFEHGAALLAGGALALTPVAVLMFRFNNPDALLTLLMALAVWATLRALEAGSYRWIALAGVFAGFGFLTKTLQVFLVVPAVAVVWMVCADTPLRRRVVGGLLSVGAFLVSAGWWVAVVELVPASWRPYIGGSQTNSFLELTFGYNGFGRLDGSEVGRVGGGGGGGFSSGTGLFRMFDSSVGGQISWLLPAALVFLVGGLVMRARAPRTDARRAGYLAMGLWLLTTALVFSFMQGIFHEYYTVALAPAIAALVGMGAGEAWDRRHDTVGALTLAAGTAAASVWGFVLLSGTTAYGGWLRFTVLALGLAATALFLVVGRLHVRALAGLGVMAVVAGLAGPAAYTASTLATGHSGSIVTAGPSSSGGPGGGFGGGPGGGAPGGTAPGGTTQGGTAPGGTTQTNPNGGTSPFAGGTQPGGSAPGAGGSAGGGMSGLLDASTPDADVVEALEADADQYTWVAAAVGSQNAAGLQLATEEPVMAIGGFNGSDPYPTLEQFQQYVADGQIHYFLAGGGFGGQQGGSDVADEINNWVSQNYTEVTIGGETFYDLTQPTGSGQ
ncbi:glycosyltransferase family 39 protein [Phycicoccus endophyticus]|uniref:Glycosyltransferase family 39 protein n=1 Tax=Phycicoccus endophyticus TaxID=1690220 RepID=A0A7G9R1K1_9MICO|nr:glycosyltransferase family 39 protein [Phycicoccus endophyticus]NHI18734.1 glycosyltransferase family 39 protein [Phycicoccus endophyticus]QNN49476.1 glycosyltransferase family 39 protein [Phycicoccus endophyticus]GGL36912.1 glycosyl transferase [Phycicoccus endophyticus]